MESDIHNLPLLVGGLLLDINSTMDSTHNVTSQGVINDTDSSLLVPFTESVTGNDVINSSTLSPYINDSLPVAEGPHCSVEVKFWFGTVAIGTLCLLGFLGNTLSILVLQKDSHNRVACYLLQALAFTDNTVLLLTMIIISLIFGLLPFLMNHSVIFEGTNHLVTLYIVKWVNPVASITQCCAVWITVLLAINRYVAICMPFQVHRWCTMTKARIQVGIVVTVSVLFNIPRFFAFNIKETSDGSHTIEFTALGGNSTFSIIYDQILLTILVLGLPLLILTVLNTKLVLEVRKMQRRARRTHTHAQLHEENITLVMITIILILLVCHTPDSILRVLSIVLPHPQQGCGTPYWYFNLVVNLLIVLNCSGNFILYYFMRRGFRKILIRKLCGCVKKAYTSTSTMLNGLGNKTKEMKLTQSKSCPELMLPNSYNQIDSEYSNAFPLNSLDELRKMSA